MNPIYYHEKGGGQVVVLLHGFCENHKIWAEIAPELSRNFRVLAPDLPGFGKSQILNSSFSIKQIGQAIISLLTALKVDQCILIGHSLGGYVALAMAQERPDLVAGICLFHSTALPDSPEKKINRNRVIDFVKKNGVGPYIETFVPGLFGQKGHPSIERVHKIASKTSKKAIIGFAAAMRDRPDMVDFIRAFPSPILFLAGEKDSIIAISDLAKQSKESFNGRLEVLSETGHMGMFEDTAKSNKILQEFAKTCFHTALR